ncbi:MAG: hypothetical protein QOH83_2061 [Solirubrobacteraceae bacterium]|nr:hypothetical protein [Solirubrobacteraceae bacterium]
MAKRRADADVLAVLGDDEKAAVLDELVAGDSRVRTTAVDAARRRLRGVDPRRVAEGVMEAVVGLDQEELAAHAGRTRHGYVEPTEAAWMLLERAVEPWVEDIARRGALGMREAARHLTLGVLAGLSRAAEHADRDGLLLSWAPDFPGEAANRVLGTLEDAGLELSDAEDADLVLGVVVALQPSGVLGDGDAAWQDQAASRCPSPSDLSRCSASRSSWRLRSSPTPSREPISACVSGSSPRSP